MINTSFYLSDYNSKRGRAIVMYLRWNRNNVKYPTGVKCKTEDWQADPIKKGYQRVKGNAGYETNRRLDHLANTARDTYQKFINEYQHIPSKRELIKALDLALNKTKGGKATFFSFADEFVAEAKIRTNKRTGKKLTKSNTSKYERTIFLLKEFNSRFSFEDIDQAFYVKFVSFLQDKDMANNTIGKHIKSLKAILNSATERGINTNLIYKSSNFAALKEESDSIYLKDQELKELQKIDLSSQPLHEQTRDLFLIGCYSGLRYSDYSTLVPENIKDGFIHKENLKTGIDIVAPVHPIVKNILAKYKGQLPASTTNSVSIRYLREIAERIPIMHEKEIISITRGGKRIIETFHRYELIGTHTARRTFATHAYLEGIPAQIIMGITGHTTEKSFMTYIKVSQKDKAIILKKFWDKKTK